MGQGSQTTGQRVGRGVGELAGANTPQGLDSSDAPPRCPGILPSTCASQCVGGGHRQLACPQPVDGAPAGLLGALSLGSCVPGRLWPQATWGGVLATADPSQGAGQSFWGRLLHDLERTEPVHASLPGSLAVRRGCDSFGPMKREHHLSLGQRQ